MIDDLKDVIRAYDSGRPRSRQVSIGPSEAGTPCGRRLAYRLLEAPRNNTDSDPWAAIVGTAIHAWLDDAFVEASKAPDEGRWVTGVWVELPGYMRGQIDLYDRRTRTVIDHKTMGAEGMRRLRKDGPGEQYRTQVHLYACGMRMAGYAVDHVAIAAWSRSGRLKDAAWWTEPYDEAVVEAALARIDALRSTTTALGAAALPLIPTADAHCQWCPYYLPASTVIEDGCPGHVEEK